VEILLVLTITLAAMAVVAPNLASGNQSSMLKGAARDLASALRFARGHALTTHQDAKVSIDLEENTYEVTGREKLFQLEKEIDITLSVAQTELSGTGAGGIRFFPDGSSSGGRVTLELGGQTQTIDINWLTGQVEINAQE
jgi:general secretion pathway protein H